MGTVGTHPHTKLVCVIDYGMGNLNSVAKAAQTVAPAHTHVEITHNPDRIEAADAIIFPGQGAARACMQALTDAGLHQPILKASHEKPFLGICMGLQVLMGHSEENQGVDCLNRLPGQTHRFNLTPYPELKLPHMGWNRIHQTLDHPIWQGIEQDAWFYFVHSYYVQPDAAETIAGQTSHGETFCSAIAQDNIFAIQAHPEKSADSGLRLLKNFMHWPGK
ncbi:imidazole glycerol phosphate synthase subunit HisH [Thiomicrospira sp. WB1]|uniref:imidazole glycerol phosphate synthase subunit HisH n=1 Tax=Thiomicrospira sp. WB1 TaxID=1685380 RepID=UPI000746B9B0|nr:imidazole glycerol phosphate synthase subunit HisH [Thiomicrospira sp. WB1]KUJ72635.1 imidazole glycerol phosphate synthase subunit HisH [Thiomicrospira sp. WB1]